MFKSSICALFVLVAANSIAVAGSLDWKILKDRWSEEDERGYGEFVRSIGESACNSVPSCLASKANPYRNTDPKGVRFVADCADLPYVLRSYYAWKKGLPFAHVNGVRVRRAGDGDPRFSRGGNVVTSRRAVTANASGVLRATSVINSVRDAVSSATFRTHPESDKGPSSDFYSPKIDRDSIRAGSMIYDVNGHVAIVYRVESDGRIHYMDAHPDNTLTRSVYGRQIPRTDPNLGAGFKNWRPIVLVGAEKNADGAFVGGRISAVKNEDIKDFSGTQYYGTEGNPDKDWSKAEYSHGENSVSYYEYVRHAMADGELVFEPVFELRAMMRTLCRDLSDRNLYVNEAVIRSIQKKAQPDNLPANIYGTHGEWEVYSTPSRDARIKTSFKAMRDDMAKYIELYYAWDERVVVSSDNLRQDLIDAYNDESSVCQITYKNTVGENVTLSFDDVMRRLFALSFDPYHCVERRWGATNADELSTCDDGPVKQSWYDAEVFLRNQIDRTYDAFMGHDLKGLRKPGRGRGVAEAPDVDVLAVIEAVENRVPASMATGGL